MSIMYLKKKFSQFELNSSSDFDFKTFKAYELPLVLIISTVFSKISAGMPNCTRFWIILIAIILLRGEVAINSLTRVKIM